MIYFLAVSLVLASGVVLLVSVLQSRGGQQKYVTALWVFVLLSAGTVLLGTLSFDGGALLTKGQLQVVAIVVATHAFSSASLCLALRSLEPSSTANALDS
ncbi:MAG: hypothetical protein Q8K99_11040 [Actinomycetota bacterium]|nr:hypothetical protein [Actinomycetota bacterium]